jgi:hypothetical protein
MRGRAVQCIGDRRRETAQDGGNGGKTAQRIGERTVRRMGRMRGRAVQWIGDRRRENRLRRMGRMRGRAVQWIGDRRRENRLRRMGEGGGEQYCTEDRRDEGREQRAG